MENLAFLSEIQGLLLLVLRGKFTPREGFWMAKLGDQTTSVVPLEDDPKIR